MAEKSTNPQLQQLEFFEIPSPCIGVCESDDKGFCKGCMRTREERHYWPQVDNATKRIIVQAWTRRKKRKAKTKAIQEPRVSRQQDLF